MFRSTTIIRELKVSLAKVTFMKSVEVRRYGPCGGVAHHRMVHNDVLLPIL
jgi:hypothetical protein